MYYHNWSSRSLPILDSRVCIAKINSFAERIQTSATLPRNHCWSTMIGGQREPSIDCEATYREETRRIFSNTIITKSGTRATYLLSFKRNIMPAASEGETWAPGLCTLKLLEELLLGVVGWVEPGELSEDEGYHELVGISCGGAWLSCSWEPL